MSSPRIWMFLAALTLPGTQTASAESVEPKTSQRPVSPQARTLRGTIRDADTGTAVAGAVVLVRGSRIRGTTDSEGRFALEAVTAEPLTLVVRRDRYASKTFQIAADATDVSLSLAPVGVEEIVVVGRATRIAKENLANSVARVFADDLEDVTSATLSEALQGKVAGANILANSGAPGGGIQMQLRGVSTINGRSEPLYVIDGVIISDIAIPSGLSAVTASTSGSSSRSTQDNQVNRIADINPNDIERIEILKGASAAAIYGVKASNGVVIITTKRGKAGAPRASVTQRLGVYTPANKLGSRTFETLEEALEHDPGAGRYYEPGRTYDHEAQLTRQREISSETVVSVSGGTASTDYYASMLVKNDEGVIPGTGYQKQSGRITIGQRFGSRLAVKGTANLIHSKAARGITNNDNTNTSHYMVLSATPNYVDLRRKNSVFPVNPYVSSGANPLQTLALMRDAEDVWRLIGGLNGTLEIFSTPNQKLELVANTGVDRFNQTNDLYFPPELHFEPNDGMPGTTLDTNSNNLNLNADANLIHVYEDEHGAFTATTSAGLQLEQRSLDSIYIVSRNLISGQSNVDQGTHVTLTESRRRIRDRGFYLQEEVVLLDDTVTLVGGIRGDQSSVNGDPDRLFFYPKAAAAYRLAQPTSFFDELKLRVAYGETGNLPLYGYKFTPLNATQTIDGRLGLVGRGVIGDPDIKPERQREVEAGVDLVGFGDRLNVELTVYQRNITDLLLERTPAPSTGARTEYFSGGELRNRGVEVAVGAKPVQRGRFSWVSRATFALNRSRVMDMPVPDFNAAGFRDSLGVFRIAEGRSVTQIAGMVTRADGTCCELGQIGDSEPDFRAGLYNSWTYGAWRLGMLLDWQQGGDIINLTRLLYDANGNSADFETAGRRRLEQFGSNTGVYVEDASFLKLRELVLSYDVPSEWLEPLGFANRAQVSLSGRNLLTFTNYSGLDPEVSNFGIQQVGRSIDVAPYPPMRSVWFSVTAGI